MVGQTVSHYRITEKLGEGGMGEVYLAEDTSLDRKVALKFLPSALQRDPIAHKRFLREAKSAAAIEHPFICNVKEVAKTEDGRDFIVMEYVEGQTLKEVLAEGRVPLNEALRIAAEVAEALEKAHQTNLVHRDLKPANIMLTPEGHAKVMDFGLAKRVLTEEPGQDITAAVATKGTTLGTLAYMSPEQLVGRALDTRSDIFSFGVVLYEMLSGVHPFKKDTGMATANAILSRTPPKLNLYKESIPDLLEHIVSKMLAKELEHRYQSVHEVRTDALELMPELDGSTQADMLRRRKSRKLATAAVGLAVLLALVLGYWAWDGLVQPPSAEPAFQSIAVLPFADLSANQENEYFGDGLAEEILIALSRLPELRVTGRTSSFGFRGENLDIKEMGSRLGVRTILSGSVRKSGNRIRVTSQLINVSDGYQMWSRRFESEMTEVFEIQDEICQAIVENLRLQLVKGRPLIERPTENVAAYNLFLQAHYYQYRWTQEGMTKSRDYLERAIAMDPDYALAYVGLAMFHYHMGYFGYTSPAVALRRCDSELRRALALNDKLAEAHAMLGVLQVVRNFAWEEAEREFLHALDLEPTSVDARNFYDFYYLVPMGRLDDALVEAQKALESDPLSPFMMFRVGFRLLLLRKFDQAAEHFRRAVELDRGYFAALRSLAWIYYQAEKIEEAIEVSQKSVELSGRNPWALGLLGNLYAQAGRVDEARALIKELTSSRPYVAPTNVAIVYFGLGDEVSGFEWLERSIQERDGLIFHLGVDPFWDFIRDDSRFEDLLRQMKLPEDLIGRLLPVPS